MLHDLNTDFLVIGSGIAGLSLALKLAESGEVLVIAKARLIDNNTWYAQGGIASVFGGTDSFDKHVRDTLEAGAGLCHQDIVRLVVERGPDAVRELIELGVDFTRSETPDSNGFPYHLTREGGHSQRRVMHASDTTGRAILEALIARVRAHPAITVRDNQLAIDLLTTDKYRPDFKKNACLGAYVLDRRENIIVKIRSRATFLCTGGHGKAYLYTSNPDCATGDGLAMAWRAGCKVANLEFMQFHPTCLYHPDAKNFLISEAVRGEGAVLRNWEGESFMERYHPLGSLAPRDIVARAIDQELKRSGRTHVYLDARALGVEKITRHFPNIHETCLKFGIDMTTQLIPVVPAAHYSCGGVVVDDCGRTGIENLFAIGEVACTGLHGANRLASNSLLEAVVFADRAAALVKGRELEAHDDLLVPPWNPGGAASPDEVVVLSHIWDEIRRLMWNYVGIVRTEKRLARAYERIVAIRQELMDYYWDYQVTDSFVEVRNLADVAFLTIRCAMHRKESRGIHFTSDYPIASDEWPPRDTIII